MKKLIERRKIAKKHTEPKLIKRLRIFLIIIAIIVCVVIYRIFQGDISTFLAVAGLLAGTLIGLIAGKMFKMLWHPETKKVISKLDKYGAIFLILYIGIELGRKWFFGHWLQGAELNTFGLIFLAGLLLGRLLAMINGIKTVLIKENKL